MAEDHLIEQLKKEIGEREKEREQYRNSLFSNIPQNTKIILLILILIFIYVFMKMPEMRITTSLIAGAVMLFLFKWKTSEHEQIPLTDQQITQLLYDQVQFKQNRPFSNNLTQMPRGQIIIEPVTDEWEVDFQPVYKRIGFRIITEDKLPLFYYACLDFFTGDIKKIIRLNRAFNPNKDQVPIRSYGMQDLVRYREAERLAKK